MNPKPSNRRLPRLGRHEIRLIVDAPAEDAPIGLISRRVSGYLQRGIDAVWLIDEQDRSKSLYRSGRGFEVLDGNDLLPEPDTSARHRIRVCEFFGDK